ncbi:hypothetical protein Tco_1149049 [Tanacetum coccineum]
MATYLKNQGGWKLAQINKLTDAELKVKFEYLMRSMERFMPMDIEKESRKRNGEELQTESSKKLKSDIREDVSVPKEKDKESVKREEEFEIKKPVLRYTKRKSLARKGLQKKPESTKSGTEEDVEAYMEERVDEPSSEEFPMSSIPQGPAPAKIVKWQIIKTGKRGAYQIIREDNTDVYGDNRPEEEFERVLWGDLKTMFDPPSKKDAIWRICKAMLEKKLLGDRKDELLQRSNRDDTSVPVSKRCCKEQGAASNSRKSNVVVPNILKDKVYNNFQKLKDEGSTDPKHLGPTSGIRATRGTLSKKNHKNNKHSLSRSRKMSHPADEFSQHLSDDDVSNHEDASDNGDATNKPKQQQLISTATTISNIKLPILKKEEYDIWAMEMEHYLEYIDNDVWKVIQNGNSKKRISTGKDGVIRVLPPVSAAEIHAVEKERKARTILLMAIPKEHLRRFHGMDDAKEIWEAIRTRFGGNANSKKMQKAVLKQQFEAFSISSSEGLEKGYDRFQQLLSQLEAHGAEVSNEDANHKFLRALPSAWSNLAMTMRTKPDVDTLSIDDLYNNLRVFEQELTSTSKSSASAQNVAFVSHSKSSTNKVKSGHTGAYSTYTPTSSNNIQEREVPAGFADEVIYSLFAKQSEDLDLLHEDLEQIDDVDIERD